MPNIIEINDFTAPELDAYARLTEAQLRNRLEPEKGIFIAESTKVIGTALDAGYEPGMEQDNHVDVDLTKKEAEDGDSGTKAL